MTYDVAAVRAAFPALRSRLPPTSTGPGGSQTPDVVAQAVAATLTAPIANRGRHHGSERNADDVVLGARQAVADLTAGDPGGVVFGRSATAAHLRLLPRAVGRAGARATRWSSPGSTTTPTCGRGCRPPRPAAPRCAGPTSTRPPASSTPAAVGALLSDAHPAGRRHRRVQPDRHPARRRRDHRARPRRRRADLGRRRAPHRARRRRRRRARRRLLRLLAVQVPRPALRLPGRRARRCWRRCTPTSCCPRPTPSPSGSSSARCPTS